MKFLVAWTVRSGGSAQDNEDALERSLAVFSKWSPPSDSVFTEFVQRLDGQGGFAVVETDNPKSVLDGPAKFAPYLEFTVTPVIDVMEGVAVASEAIAFRKGIS